MFGDIYETKKKRERLFCNAFKSNIWKSEFKRGIFKSERSESKKTVIMFRENEFYQDSYSHRKQKKYKHIFYLTFCAPEIYFVNENENEKIIFERADAVSNAIDYL